MNRTSGNGHAPAEPLGLTFAPEAVAGLVKAVAVEIVAELRAVRRPAASRALARCS